MERFNTLWLWATGATVAILLLAWAEARFSAVNTREAYCQQAGDAWVAPGVCGNPLKPRVAVALAAREQLQPASGAPQFTAAYRLAQAAQR